MTRHSEIRIETLRSLPPFAACTRRELELADSVMTRISLRAGTMLTRQGAVARECYLVEEGVVGVVRDDEQIAEIGPGEWAGELALLDGRIRTATLVTLTDVVLNVMHAGEFGVLRDIPSVGADVNGVAATRRSRLPVSVALA